MWSIIHVLFSGKQNWIFTLESWKTAFKCLPQFVAGKEVVVSIYHQQFWATKICQKHLKAVEVIDFKDTFCCSTFMLIQKAMQIF